MGYSLQSPWDLSGPTPDPDSTAAPAKKPKTDDENAAFGGNTNLYQPPAPPRSPWDAPKAPGAGTPTAASSPQGARAAPPAAPSLNLSPVGPAPTPYQPQQSSGYGGATRSFSVPQVIKSTLPTGSNPIPGSGISGKTITGMTGPSIGTSGVPQAVQTATQTGKIPPVLIGGGTPYSTINDIATKLSPISEGGDYAHTAATTAATASKAAAGRAPAVAKNASTAAGNASTASMAEINKPILDNINQILAGSKVTSDPNYVIDSLKSLYSAHPEYFGGTGGGGGAGGAADILGPLTKAVGIPGVGGPSTPGGSATDIAGGLSSLGQGMDPNAINWGNVPGINGATSIMHQFGDVLSDPGAWLQGMGDKVGDMLGFNDTKAQDQMQNVLDSAQSQYQTTQGINKNLDTADTSLMNQSAANTAAYQSDRNASLNPYLDQIGGLRNQADANYLTAGNQVTGLANQTAKDQGLAQSQMNDNYTALSDLNASADQTAYDSGRYNGQAVNFNDPNNQIAQANRNLYNQQAAGTRRAGLADAGVLSALGAQANAGAFAGQPMTGGQLQAAAGASQNRAGQAYATAQQRALDLQDQGLARGYEQTQAAYGRNQDALNRQRQSQLDLSGQATTNANTRNMMQNQVSSQLQSGQNMMQGLRDERGNLDNQQYALRNNRAQEDFDLGNALSGQAHDLAGAQDTRNLAASNQFYGTQQQAYGGMASLADAARTGKLGFWQSTLGHVIDAIPESMKGTGSILQGFGEAVPF